jgi:hypothetical protein
VSFATINLCVASQRVFIVFVVYFVIDSVFWIHPRRSSNFKFSNIKSSNLIAFPAFKKKRENSETESTANNFSYYFILSTVQRYKPKFRA